jgi:hypothetical protein
VEGGERGTRSHGGAGVARPLLIFTVKSKDDQQTLSPHGCPCHLRKKTRQKKGLEGMGGDQ